MNDKDAYIQKMRAKLDEWNAKLQELKARAAAAEADVQIELNRQLDTMYRQYSDLEQKLQGLQVAGEDAWEDLHAGFEAAWKDVSASFNRAMEKFK